MKLLAAAWLVLLFARTAFSRLEILSFNVKQFGMAKISNQEAVDILIKIVEQYDISLIMEVVDVSETVIPNFVMQLNSAQTSGMVFDYSISERLGTSKNKEQYAYIYRTKTVRILDVYQYPESYGNFSRPPFCILAQSINPDTGDLPKFFLVGIHTKPDDADIELNFLDDVLVEAASAFKTQNGMVLGDFNADCSYVSASKFLTLDLVMDTSVTWWIDSETDTTTGNSDCAYDRIVTSANLTQYVVDGSAGVVRFDIQFDLTQEEVASVSDHYPVEIALQGSPSSPPSSSSSPPSPTPTPDSSGSSTSAFKFWSLVLFALFLVLLA